MSYRKMGIRGKLLFAVVVVVGLLMSEGFATSFFMKKTLSIYESIVRNNVPNLALFIRMKDAQKSMVIPLATLIATNSTAAEANAVKKESDGYLAAWNQCVKEYEATPFVAGEEEAWNTFQNKHWKPFLANVEEMIRLSGTGNRADMKRRDEMWTGEFLKQRTDLHEAFEKLMGFQLTETRTQSDAGELSAAHLSWTLLFVILAGTCTAVFFGWYLSSQLSGELTQVSESVGKGADELNSAVGQLAGAAQELASASSQQAASLQETAAAIEEITQMVQRATDSARDSSRASSESRSNAERGQQVVEQMIESMKRIDSSNGHILTQITEGNQRIAELVTVIQQIASKTKVINDIVFQTKLLSFNASVEAARAGEHGKGFAVVAEEVGNLAQMSGNAAKDISRMLEESVARVQTVVSETKSRVEELIGVGRSTVEQGNQVAQQCGDVLKEIVTNVTTVSESINAIANASSEQARGVEEINRAIQELDQVTQTNTAAANASAAAAEQISQQAVVLRGSADNLRVVVKGGERHLDGPGNVSSLTAKSNAAASKRTLNPKLRKAA